MSIAGKQTLVIVLCLCTAEVLWSRGVRSQYGQILGDARACYDWVNPMHLESTRDLTSLNIIHQIVKYL